METTHVYVFKTISDDPDGRSWIEEQHGIHRTEMTAIADARAWMAKTLADWDDPDATVTEFVAEDGNKFILTMKGYDGEWMHKAVVTREELK